MQDHERAIFAAEDEDQAADLASLAYPQKIVQFANHLSKSSSLSRNLGPARPSHATEQDPDLGPPLAPPEVTVTRATPSP
ncbi:unnamed protein product [Prunus armeniaca]